MDPLLIIDTTRAGTIGDETDTDRALQQVVARWLHLPLERVQQRWVAIDLSDTRLPMTLGSTYVSSKAVLEREMTTVRHHVERKNGHGTLKKLHAVVVVDDGAEGIGSVLGGLAVLVARWTDGNPMILGVSPCEDVLTEGYSGWYAVDSIPLSCDDDVLKGEIIDTISSVLPCSASL